MTDSQSSQIIPIPQRMRLAMQVGSAIAVAVAVTLVLAQRGAWPVSVALLVAAGLVLLRGVRARIELGDDELVVRDSVVSTRIPRARVVSVDRFPSIDWRGANGITRETLVSAFGRHESGFLVPTEAELERIRAELRAWTGARSV